MARIARVWCVRAPGSFAHPSERSAEHTAPMEGLTPRQGTAICAPSSDDRDCDRHAFIPTTFFFLPPQEFFPASRSLRAETGVPGNAGHGPTPQAHGACLWHL